MVLSLVAGSGPPLRQHAATAKMSSQRPLSAWHPDRTPSEQCTVLSIVAACLMLWSTISVLNFDYRPWDYHARRKPVRMSLPR